ncbi:MAG: hypothetical protein SNJ59_05265 [Aggregatilineales bacterium]
MRVLTGQSGQEAQVDRTIQALDLVMADKTGISDPSLIAAADRIEAASGSVDIIEIRHDLNERIFTINLLFRPPQTDNTVQGQVARLDALRRAVELSWQGTMRESEGADLLRITLLAPQTITTLDHGSSFIGVVIAETEIERGAAANYLAGPRSLNSFFDLIAQGILRYTNPEQVMLYEGQPNHPMFMLPSAP